MTITAALERDPAFRLASWRVKAIYPQLRRRQRIECLPGCDLVDSLVVTLKGLSTTPRDDVSAALDEMRARGLLVELEGGALAPKHAPRPRPERAPRRERAPLPAAAPGSEDARLRRAFSVHLSREHRDHPARSNPAAWAGVVAELWEAYAARYHARRRPAAVTTAVTAPPEAPVTGLVTVAVTDVAVTTAPGEGGEGEKESLSSSGDFGGKTSQEPPAREGRVVTVRDVTAPVTVTRPAPPPPAAPPAAAPGVDAEALRRALAATDGRVGSAGRADFERVLAVLLEESVTAAELAALGRLARARRLYLQDKHDRVSLAFVLRDGAKILYRWLDDTRAELARQPQLGLAANDAHPAPAQARPPPTAQAPPRAAESLSRRVAPGQVVGMLPFGPRRTGGAEPQLAQATGTDAPG